MKKYNKTIAAFEFQGVSYEIDWLTDIDYGDGFKEYDIFDGKGEGARCVGHISSKNNAISHLIELAKEELTSKG